MKHFEKTIITCLTIFTLSYCIPAEAAGDVNPDPYQRIVITMLSPDINKAIQEYYGEEIRGYDLYDAKVSKLESLRGWSDFNVTVEVPTFFGAHNPPRALEYITFYVTLDKKPVLIKYEHEDVVA